MRDACRAFVNDFSSRLSSATTGKREWSMDPKDRLLPKSSSRPTRSASARLGVPEEFGAARRSIRKTEVPDFCDDLGMGKSRAATPEDSSDKLVQIWKGVGTAAQHRAAPPAGAVVSAHRARPEFPAVATA